MRLATTVESEIGWTIHDSVFSADYKGTRHQLHASARHIGQQATTSISPHPRLLDQLILDNYYCVFV